MSAAAQPPLDPEAPPPVVDPAAPPPAVDLATLQRQMAELQASAAESTRTAQYWYDKAQAKEAPAPKETPAPAAAADDEPDLLDVITAKGTKGLAAELAKLGFVREADMHGAINARANQLATEAQLVKAYPQLEDHDSDFFKATSLEYGGFKKAGISEDLAMKLAVERTELAFLRSGKLKTPGQIAEDTKAQKEADRKARIQAQASDRGSRAAQPEDDSDELTHEQEIVAVHMLQGMTGDDGKPYTREQAIDKYKARAKKGVAVRGGMR